MIFLCYYGQFNYSEDYELKSSVSIIHWESCGQTEELMTITPELQDSSQRLVSLDALRGFDMFMIMGAQAITRILTESTGWRWLEWINDDFEHPDWNGFTFFDLIFPLFMFLTGVSFVFSLNKRLKQGQSLLRLHGHIIKRGLLLILWGAICNGLLAFDFDNMVFCSVLGRIGLGYMAGALLAIHIRSLPGRLISCAILLIGYWAAMTLIPVPEFGAGDLTPGHTLSSYIDRLVLPGRLFASDRDPNGLFSTIPSIVNVLAGIMTGELLRTTTKTEYYKVVTMLCVGILCWATGHLWDGWFPINKKIWSSSFVLVTVGWSLMALSLFYLVIDVWKFRRGTILFVVIGMNPLLIYVVQQFVAFREIAHFLLHDEDRKLHPIFIEFAMFAMKWSLLYVLYRKRIFWRI